MKNKNDPVSQGKSLGGKNFTQGCQWQWGDVESAMKFWSEAFQPVI